MKCFRKICVVTYFYFVDKEFCYVYVTYYIFTEASSRE